MMYYLFVDPSVLKLNRDMHKDDPSIVIRDDAHNQVAVAHEVAITNGRLMQFADGMRLKMGPHVAVELEGPVSYREDKTWKVLE